MCSMAQDAHHAARTERRANDLQRLLCHRVELALQPAALQVLVRLCSQAARVAPEMRTGNELEASVVFGGKALGVDQIEHKVRLPAPQIRHVPDSRAARIRKKKSMLCVLLHTTHLLVIYLGCGRLAVVTFRHRIPVCQSDG
eukprot:COSAG06_NODE_1417_length_9526_cov_9.513207_4_plen_142_part_00